MEDFVPNTQALTAPAVESDLRVRTQESESILGLCFVAQPVSVDKSAVDEMAQPLSQAATSGRRRGALKA